MPTQALYLGDLVGSEEIVPLDAACHRCGEVLGPYLAARADGDGPVTLGPARGTMGAHAVHPEPGQWKTTGPRTQRGLRWEFFEGRTYMRKHCTCGANEKYRDGGMDDHPVTRRPDGTVVIAL
jgi:hypothetical protein